MGDRAGKMGSKTTGDGIMVSSPTQPAKRNHQEMGERQRLGSHRPGAKHARSCQEISPVWASLMCQRVHSGKVGTGVREFSTWLW